jgi:hypothetical protein
MPDQERRSWHHEPDIGGLSPDSYTAQKLVGIYTVMACNALIGAATCDARTCPPYLEALLHWAYPSMFYHCPTRTALMHSDRRPG